MLIKEFLEKRKMGVSEFARIAGLKQSYISLLVHQKRRPSADLALRIEQATGGAVTIMELLFPPRKIDEAP